MNGRVADLVPPVRIFGYRSLSSVQWVAMHILFVLKTATYGVMRARALQRTLDSLEGLGLIHSFVRDEEVLYELADGVRFQGPRTLVMEVM
jgi:hypothetical protein